MIKEVFLRHFRFKTHLNLLACSPHPASHLTHMQTPHSSSSLQEPAAPAFIPSPIPFPQEVESFFTEPDQYQLPEHGSSFTQGSGSNQPAQTHQALGAGEHAEPSAASSKPLEVVPRYPLEESHAEQDFWSPKLRASQSNQDELPEDMHHSSGVLSTAHMDLLEQAQRRPQE